MNRLSAYLPDIQGRISYDTDSTQGIWYGTNYSTSGALSLLTITGKRAIDGVSGSSGERPWGFRFFASSYDSTYSSTAVSSSGVRKTKVQPTSQVCNFIIKY